MQKQLVIGDKKIVIGDQCVITENGMKNGFGPINILLDIFTFKKTFDEILIGIHSHIYIKEWADLNGAVTPGHGLWITPSNFLTNMQFIPIKYEICNEFKFKNQNLELMQCKILHSYKDGNVFIEIDKNVGGGSCDGLGKTGHCIILPQNRLKKIKFKKQSNSESKNPNIKESKHYD